MTERATFKYTGPDQAIRIGSTEFRRDREVLVTDAEEIAEARTHPEVSEQEGDGWVANRFPAEAAAEAAPPEVTEPPKVAPPPAAPVTPIAKPAEPS